MLRAVAAATAQAAAVVISFDEDSLNLVWFKVANCPRCGVEMLANTQSIPCAFALPHEKFTHFKLYDLAFLEMQGTQYSLHLRLIKMR